MLGADRWRTEHKKISLKEKGPLLPALGAVTGPKIPKRGEKQQLVARSCFEPPDKHSLMVWAEI